MKKKASELEAGDRIEVMPGVWVVLSRVEWLNPHTVIGFYPDASGMEERERWETWWDHKVVNVKNQTGPDGQNK